jgi:1-phosphofructokinase
VIVTVTFNPSVDRTIAVDVLRRGEVNRASTSRVDPGGKGINVSRALTVHGIKTRAVVALGGPEGDHLERLLTAGDLEVLPVRIAGSIRSNVTVVEPDGTTTKLNERGACLSTHEVDLIVEAAVAACSDADWLVASGSLPPGAPGSLYADVAARLAGTRTRVVVDTSGKALAAALAGRPHLVKPNSEELAECVGRALLTLGDAITACHTLRERGAGAVLASLGSAGAILVDGAGVTHAHAAPTVPVSSVGAGDALLAGFLAAGGEGTDALVEAVAWGAAAVTLPGSRMPAPSDLRRDGVVLDGSPRLDLPLSGTG